MSLVTLFAVCAFSIDSCEDRLQFIGLNVRLFVSECVLPKPSDTVNRLGTSLMSQEQTCSICAVMKDIGIEAKISVCS